MQLSFSRYLYKPRSREDSRERFVVPITAVNASWFRREIKAIEVGQELAFESRIRWKGQLRHVPMIDFKGTAAGQLRAILDIFPGSHKLEPFVYYSGRSFHAYFLELLSNRDWIRFMGSALLCNTPDNPNVVDQRWIGHRLIAGYSSLRWSVNGSRHKTQPRRVPSLLLDVSAREKRKVLTIL